MEVFITDYEQKEPLERFVFRFKRTRGSDGNRKGVDTISEQKIIDRFASAVLQILIDTPHFPSRGSKFFLQFHLKDEDIGLSNAKFDIVEYVSISTVKCMLLTKIMVDDIELEIVKEMNLEA